jgi:hypothetical protein
MPYPSYRVPVSPTIKKYAVWDKTKKRQLKKQELI